jgi:predicted aspartyl protease
MKSVYCLAAIVLALFMLPSQAETCTKPLKIVAKVRLTASPDNRRLYVPITINGQQKRLLLDTGAVSSVISAKVAKELGLTLVKANVGVGNFQFSVYDLTGAVADQMTTAAIQIGQVKFSRVNFMVSSQEDQLDYPDVIGLLGSNILSMFDVSIDVPGRTLDLIDQDHCPDQVVYWPATGLARIPFHVRGSDNIVIPVTLDDQPLTAIVDTGAWHSTLRIRTARAKFDIVPGSSDTPAEGTLNGVENLTTYTHVFKKLDFEGVAVGTPTITLIPDQISEKLTEKQTGSNIPVARESTRAPMLLGMNILRHLHIYIAYKDQVLYFTASETKAPKEETKPETKTN